MVELGEREIALAPSCACGPRDRSTDLRASTSRLSASACKGNGRAEEKLVGITRRVGRGLMNRGRDIEGGGTALQPITTAQAERPRGTCEACGFGRASEASFEFCLSRSSSSAVSDSAVEAAELAGVKLF